MYKPHQLRGHTMARYLHVFYINDDNEVEVFKSFHVPIEDKTAMAVALRISESYRKLFTEYSQTLSLMEFRARCAMLKGPFVFAAPESISREGAQVLAQDPRFLQRHRLK